MCMQNMKAMGQDFDTESGLVSVCSSIEQSCLNSLCGEADRTGWNAIQCDDNLAFYLLFNMYLFAFIYRYQFIEISLNERHTEEEVLALISAGCTGSA